MAQTVAPKESKSPQLLLHLLCGKITGLKDESLEPYYKMALSTLGSTIATPTESDEFEVAEKIKKKLVRQRRERDAAIFSELHRKLQGQAMIKNRWAILYLLMKLSEDKNKPKNTQPTPFMQGLHSYATSTPYVRSTPAVPQSFGRTPGAASMTHYSTDSSGISSIHGSTRSTEPTPFPQSLPTSYAQTPGMRLFETIGNRTQQTESSMMTRTNRGTSSISRQKHRQKKTDKTTYELPEFALVRELVYVFQGIEGRYIKYDASADQFKVDSQVGVTKTGRQTVNKLAEAGWLYNKVRKYADSRSTDRAFGQVGQSFCAALQEEMAEYLRLLGVLDAQLQQEEDLGLSMDLDSGMTLRKLRVWMFDPMTRLKVLAALVDICQGKKGGALASAIHSYIQHADPSIRSLIKHKLTLVAEPIFTYIIRWMYGGQLEDTYHEFFVASDPTVKDDRLWREKYTLRKSMVPTFLTTPQAQKILLTGKSINFLRQVCQDRTRIRNRDTVKAAETEQVESIFSEDLDGVFQNMIDVVCKETSLHLLDVLYNKYKFMDHLKAMRRYLLLGQGDFIRHLMDLLEEHLAKKADTLFLHNLSGILETAVRATNAQYDDVDILKRLDVRLLEVSPGDIGWDVFSLDYRVDGPIKTVFTPECMVKYLRVFNFLWRAKRMEYILAGIWKGQMGNARFLRSIPELGPVLHQCHVIAAEMVHFVQQVQYYINFEVLECSWDELLQKVTEAEDLDCIIKAHENFLDTVIARSFIDNNSTSILAQLRTIFDLIISFQKIQDEMYTAATTELEHRQAYIKSQEDKTKKNQWGLLQEDEDEEMERRNRFVKKLIPSTRSQLRVLLQSYQEMAQQLLVMLATYSDASLRFLSFRLDFNEYYRAKEPKLRSPLAYHKVKSRRP